MLTQKFEKDLHGTGSAVDEMELVITNTCELEYYAAAECEVSVYGADDTLYFCDTLTHGHTFFVRSGNQYAIISTSALTESTDIPVSNTPLKVTASGNMSFKFSEV